MQPPSPLLCTPPPAVSAHRCQPPLVEPPPLKPSTSTGASPLCCATSHEAKRHRTVGPFLYEPSTLDQCHSSFSGPVTALGSTARNRSTSPTTPSPSKTPCLSHRQSSSSATSNHCCPPLLLSLSPSLTPNQDPHL
jgi:hypothetical protein